MSNFNVFYRIRKINNSNSIIQTKDNSIIVENNRPRVNNKKHYKIFKNLNIFDKDVSNYDIFNPLFRQKLLEFIKNDILTFSTLAYGQTGSGKTYTLFGNQDSKGLIFNILQILFDNNIKPSISCLQIYNNTIYDLLNNNNIIRVFDTPGKVVYSTDIKHIYLNHYDQANSQIHSIMSNRIVGATKLNQQSSRSHLIVTLSFKDKKIYIIDLAGNEKGKYSNANKDKQKLQEYIHINKSLFSLKECIYSFSTNKKYIPYRNSKLTLLLREVFFNNGFVSFIANLSPMKEHYYDIIDTIKFATSLQKQRIVLTVHKKTNKNELIKNYYYKYILELYRLIYKDTQLYEKIKNKNATYNIEDIVFNFDEKFELLHKYYDYFKNNKDSLSLH